MIVQRFKKREDINNQSNQLTNDAVKPFNIYRDSVKKANVIREESIKRQKNLLCTYQNM